MHQNIVEFRAKSFLSERNTSSIAYEVKGVRALWDPSLSIPGTNRRGGWRCPIGTRYGGQITDRFGRSCGWGIARRIANQISDIGQRLENVDDVRRGNRIARRERRILDRLNTGDGVAGRLERGLRGFADRLEGQETSVPLGTPRRTVTSRTPRLERPAGTESVNLPQAGEGIQTPQQATPRPRRRRAPNLRDSEARRMERELEQPGAPRTGEVAPTRPRPLGGMIDPETGRVTPLKPDPNVEQVQEMIERARTPRAPRRRRGNLRESEQRRMDRELEQPGAPRTGEKPARRRRRAVVDEANKPKAPTRQEEQPQIAPVNLDGIDEVDLNPIPENIRNMTDEQIETELAKKGGVNRERMQFLMREQTARKLRAQGKDKPEAVVEPKVVKPRRPKPKVDVRERDSGFERMLDEEEEISRRVRAGENVDIGNPPKDFKEVGRGRWRKGDWYIAVDQNEGQQLGLTASDRQGNVIQVRNFDQLVERMNNLPQPADNNNAPRNAPPPPPRLPPPPQRPMLNPVTEFTKDEDREKINYAINNINFDITNTHDNMRNVTPENLEDLKQTLDREKQYQETLKERLRDAAENWSDHKNLIPEVRDAVRGTRRDAYLAAWSAQQGSKEKIDLMEMRVIEVEAGIINRPRRNPRQRELVDDPAGVVPQPPADRYGFGNPVLAAEFDALPNITYEEINYAKLQFNQASGENPVMYSAALLQDGVYGDVEVLNQIIKSNSERAQAYNETIRTTLRDINNGLAGEERRRAIQKMAKNIQARERMYEENRIISAVIEQNPFGIAGAAQEPRKPETGLFENKPVADVDDPAFNADIDKLLESADKEKYSQAKERYKAILERRLNEYVNWEPLVRDALFNGDYGDAETLDRRIEQNKSLAESYENEVKSSLETIKEKIQKGEPIEIQLEKVAELRAKLARNKVERRLFVEFRGGNLAPAERFKLGEPKGIQNTPENILYKTPTPIKWVEPDEEKLIQDVLLLLDKPSDLQRIVSVIDQKQYTFNSESVQRLERRYVDDLTRRVQMVVDGANPAAVLQSIKTEFSDANIPDATVSETIQRYQNVVTSSLQRLQKILNGDDAATPGRIESLIGQIADAKGQIAYQNHRLRQKNLFKTDFENSLRRLEGGYFVNPDKQDSSDITPEQVKLDIDASIEKSIDKRGSKIEEYLKNTYPDYGGDPNDPSNTLPAFVNMTKEKWATLSKGEKKRYLKDAYSHSRIEGKNGKIYRATVEDINFSDDSTRVEVTFDEIDENGRVIRSGIANSTRYVEFVGDEGSVSNASFFIYNNIDKGADIATIYNGVAFKYLSAIGVTQAKVNPADDGQYVWARIGFRNSEQLDSTQLKGLQQALKQYELVGGSGLIRTDEEYQRVKAFLQLAKNGVPVWTQDAIFIMDSGNIQDIARRDYIKHWFIDNMPLYPGAVLNFDLNKIKTKSAFINLKRKTFRHDRSMKFKRQR